MIWAGIPELSVIRVGEYLLQQTDPVYKIPATEYPRTIQWLLSNE
jgi:hypothetical protein